MTSPLKERWLFAVSGGPDSMATLRMHIDKAVCVCHVNYNSRPTSLRDELLVKHFCQKNLVPFFVRRVKHTASDGNFQNWARHARYAFFVETAVAQLCDRIVTGHTSDDFLETALMQSFRGGPRLFFGIEENVSFQGLPVYRPCLSLSKQELLNYAKKLEVPFAFDETNESEKYQRNRIRKMLGGMPELERKRLLETYMELNVIFSDLRAKVFNAYREWALNEYSIPFFIWNIPSSLHIHVLYTLFESIGLTNRSSNKAELLVEFIKKGRTNTRIRIGENFFVAKRNAQLVIEKSAPL